MVEELKSCPFCGGRAELETERVKNLNVGVVQCTNCTAEVWGAKAWNTRSPAWRDIESAPRDGTPILAHRPNENFPGYDDHAVVKWHEGTWMVHPTRDGRLSYIPTHWMPLPLPPEEKA